MDRQTLTRRITYANGGKILITKNMIGRTLGIGKPAVVELMHGYDFTVSGKNHCHMYLVDDVADAILKGRRI